VGIAKPTPKTSNPVLEIVIPALEIVVATPGITIPVVGIAKPTPKTSNRVPEIVIPTPGTVVGGVEIVPYS